MDHSTKFINLQSLLFSLILFSQLLRLTLSDLDPNTNDNFPNLGPLHPDDVKVLLQIQKQLGNNTQPWTTSNMKCCYMFCTSESILECSFDGDYGHVEGLTLTFNTPNSCGDKSANVIPLALGDLVSLKYLYLLGPHYTGPIMARDFGMLTNLSALHITNTSIRDPFQIGSLLGMKNLRSLVLTNNKFLTRFPTMISQLTGLYNLDLSSNRLSGLIPDFLGRLSSLERISLKSNRFSGPIPVSLDELNVEILDLSHNQLTGEIPGSLGRNINNFGLMDLSHNQLNGLVPDGFGLFNNFISLKLNDNRLTGSIPRTITQAKMSKIDVSSNKLMDASNLFWDDIYFDLSHINISNNHLNFDFSNAHFPQKLQSLNMSHNKIYGSLPKTLSQLFSLDSVDVSYNQLCGPIPTSSVLERFNATNFSHNKCLCGAPLAPCK